MMCKGGVGKTTASLFLSQRLAGLGHRVLALDTDPQGNLTAAFQPMRFGFNITEKTPVLMDVMIGNCRLREAILEFAPKLHLLPSTAINSLLERKLLQSSEMPVPKLDRLLRQLDRHYDYIIIDSAPTLNLINAAIIYASSLVILPTQLDEFARMGLKQTISEIRDLEREFKFKTSIRILLNRFNAKDKESFIYLGYLAEHYRSLMLSSTIRASRTIRKAISVHRDITVADRTGAGRDFDGLAREISALNKLRSSEDLHAGI